MPENGQIGNDGGVYAQNLQANPRHQPSRLVVRPLGPSDRIYMRVGIGFGILTEMGKAVADKAKQAVDNWFEPCAAATRSRGDLPVP